MAKDAVITQTAENPLEAMFTHRPLPEVAAALRSAVEDICVAWDAVVRQAMPQMRHLSFRELEDSTPQILRAIADALASDDPRLIRGLLHAAPAQGLSRLALHFDVVEVMEEDRLLRAVTVEHIEARLGRRMDVAESAALHAAIDLMLQRSVIALVDEQKVRLRAAAEAELKFLSYMSHDLNHNLGNITLWLEVLGEDLRQTGRFAAAEESLTHARRSITDTVAGMRQLLEHERLRKGGEPRAYAAVDLHAVATRVMGQFQREARVKGLQLVVEVPPGTLFESQSELLTIVLQNLVGNAVKVQRQGHDPARVPVGERCGPPGPVGGRRGAGDCPG